MAQGYDSVADLYSNKVTCVLSLGHVLVCLGRLILGVARTSPLLDSLLLDIASSRSTKAATFT